MVLGKDKEFFANLPLAVLPCRCAGFSQLPRRVPFGPPGSAPGHLRCCGRRPGAQGLGARAQWDLPGPGANLCLCHGFVPAGKPYGLAFLPQKKFIFNEGRFSRLPVLASATSHGSAQARVGSSLLACLPPPTPPRCSGEVRVPESHRKPSLVIILHAVVCMSLSVLSRDLSAWSSRG